MTNLQLLLSIGIPSILVILSWINNSQRLTRLEAGLDATNRRLDDTNKRLEVGLDACNKRLDSGLEALYKRIEDGRADSHKDALEIMRSMTALHERLAVVEAKQA
jgi:hypothetical protein